MIQRPFHAAAYILLLAALGGCASVTFAPMTVTARDATSHEPIAGAIIVADTPSRNHPFSLATMLGKTGPISTQGVTDSQGQVRLRVPEGRPVRIGVLKTDRVPSFIWIGLGLPTEEESKEGWITVEQSVGGDHSGTEIRVEHP